MPRETSSLAPPSPEHRRVAAGQFERANQVVAAGNYDYGIRLLLSCCELDPANLIYRQALRRTQKLKFKNNLRGSWLAWLTTAPTKAKMRRALSGEDYQRVLVLGEYVLTRNPWDIKAQMGMATAADEMGLLDLAVWLLEQARQKAQNDGQLNRALARLYESRGNFKEAIALWEMVRKAEPGDNEAQSKAKDLAAHETIARGHYGEAVSGSNARPTDVQGDRVTPPPAASPRRRTSAEPPSAERQPNEPPTSSNAKENRQQSEVARLKARIDADPTNAANYLQLAGMYRKAGQIDAARTLLAHALGATGKNFEIAHELADIEIEPFRHNLTITESRLEEAPNDEELRRIRVRLLKEINARELEMHRIKADRFPSDLTNRFELGVRLLRGGQIEEAIKELQAARTDPRVQWKCLLFLGHCFKARNNWKLARRNFEEGLQNVPTGEAEVRKELYWQLASGCAESGDFQAAVDFGTELANLDYGYRTIGELIDQWQKRIDQNK